MTQEISLKMICQKRAVAQVPTIFRVPLFGVIFTTEAFWTVTHNKPVCSGYMLFGFIAIFGFALFTVYVLFAAEEIELFQN